MEYTPPPLFKQGPSARARLVFFVLLSFSVLVLDVRYQASGLLRNIASFVLYPAQLLVGLPGQLFSGVDQHFKDNADLKVENLRLQKQHLADMKALHQLAQLTAENNQLRKMMAAGESSEIKGHLAEIKYEAKDPYSRKIIVDKGSLVGVLAGQPVIDDAGVLGQVTRVFPQQSEVTLLTDKNQATPIQNLRTGLRGVAYGGQEGGLLELRFVAANADVEVGDSLVTSGIDGMFPAGLPVAKVLRVERNSSYAFARILCEPVAGVDKHRFVLVLPVDNPLPPPAVEPDTKGSARRGKKER
jgi:rod shape-determining protein MreC